METVLVLPLYLLLLGALFIFGDILMARLHLSSVERTFAWRGGHRFPVSPLRPLLLEMMPETHLVEGLTVNDVAKHDDGSTDIMNGWLEFVAARAGARVEVPFWIGMANTAQIMNPEDDRPLRFTSQYDLYAGAAFHRSWVVRRYTPADEYARSRPADELNFGGIAFDNQVMAPPSGGASFDASIPVYTRNTYLLPLCE